MEGQGSKSSLFSVAVISERDLNDVDGFARQLYAIFRTHKC